MTKDSLYEIMMMHLESPEARTWSNEELFYAVVADYILDLFEMGHVPQRWLDEIEKDTYEDAQEMFRKITYGHLSIEEFQMAQMRKKSS